MFAFLNRPVVLAVLAVCLGAALLRVAAARGELWFDEIWSITMVNGTVHSPADILFTITHDNNHLLNSFCIYLIGPGAAEWMYRLPAVVAGSLTVFLVGWAQRRKGPLTALAAVVLTGFSFVLVNYSSEARGYAFQMFFVAVAFAALSEADESPHIGWDGLFGLACILGFLAHPLFLVMYSAAQLWTWIPQRGAPRRNRALTLLLRTVLPGLFFAWLYWVNFRHLTIGGGSANPPAKIVIQTLSLAVGGPFTPPGAHVAAAIATLLLAAGLWSAGRQSLRRSLFYFAAIIGLPAIMLAVDPRNDLYPRYFLVSFVVLLLLWSDAIGWVARRFPKLHYWPAVVLAAFILANAGHIRQLLIHGRGQYRKVIKTIVAQTPSDPIRVVIDHHLRQGGMLTYYGQQQNLPREIGIATPSPEALQAAQWYLLQKPVDQEPPATIVESGATFTLVKHFPYAGLSGWQLWLYHRNP